MLIFGLLAAGLAASAGPTQACSGAVADTQRSACLLSELGASDQAINTTYAALRARSDDAGKLVLRDAQRAWIRRRDQVCQIERSDGERSAWLAALSQDYAKTVCVIRFTGERVVELKTALAQGDGAAAAPPRAAAAAPLAPASPATASSAAVYDLRSQTPRLSGKWYFEAVLKIGQLAKTSELALFIGARGPRGENAGTLQSIRKQDVERADRNIGVAVDLDDGKLYLRVNGTWNDGGPGSSGGLDLKLGRAYMGWISSSVALDQDLAAGTVKVNFGEQPFVYATPDGYLPMDASPAVRIPTPPE